MYDLKNVLPLDLAIRHFAMMPYSTSSGIVRNAVAPNSLPMSGFAFGFGGVYLDR